MKKLIQIFVISFLSNFFISTICQAQWQPDVRLTYNGSSNLSFNNAWNVASSGNTVHVIWFDSRDGNREIYYKRSSDGGISWGQDTRLTNNSADSYESSICVSGLLVHVVWEDNRDGNYEIYYKRSTDGGINWGLDTRLTNNSSVSENPSVAASGLNVHVVWEDARDNFNNMEIYYKNSTDGGVSWNPDTRLTIHAPSIPGAYFPSVAVSGSVVHTAWTDGRDGGYRGDIYYKSTTNGGVNWGSDSRLTFDGVSDRPSIAVSGSLVHIAYQYSTNGNYEIYYKRSTNGGTNWDANTRLTYDSAISENPSIAVSGSLVHVIWDDHRDGNPEIYYKLSINGGISWGQDTRLTFNSANSYFPSVAVGGPNVHAVWKDYRNGNPEVYYKLNSTGNSIGIKKISTDTPDRYDLSQNYPNPFNPATTIQYSIPKSGFVKLVIYDILGKEVETLVNEKLTPGEYSVTFDGSKLASGIYFYQLTVDNQMVETKKMVLTK